MARRELGVVERRLLVVAPAVVAQVDAAGVELLVYATEVGVVEIERLGELVDLRERDAAVLLATVDQGGERAVQGVTDGPSHTRIVLTE